MMSAIRERQVPDAAPRTSRSRTSVQDVDDDRSAHRRIAELERQLSTSNNEIQQLRLTVSSLSAQLAESERESARLKEQLSGTEFSNGSVIDTLHQANAEMQILRDEIRLNGSAMLFYDATSNGYWPAESASETDIASGDEELYTNFDEEMANSRVETLPASMVTDIEDVAGQQLLQRLSTLGISQPPPLPPPRGTNNTSEDGDVEPDEDGQWLQSFDDCPPPVPPRTRNTGDISAIGRRFENAFKGRTALLSLKIYASNMMLHSLLDRNVLTAEQVADIKNCSRAGTDRNIRMMELLTTRPDQHFETFIGALRESGQHEVADILTK